MVTLILLLAVTASTCNYPPLPEPTPVLTESPAPPDILLLETFDAATASDRWLPVSGTWEFTPGALVQTDAGEFFAAIGYADPVEWGALRVVLQHEQGSGGGLLFNAAQPGSRNDAHIVLFQGGRLAWGYYNTQGEFIRQGSAPLDHPGTAPHALDVVITGTRYAVRLDGVTLMRNMALINTEGYIGLLSASSAVRFTSVVAYSAGLLLPEWPIDL